MGHEGQSLKLQALQKGVNNAWDAISRSKSSLRDGRRKHKKRMIKMAGRLIKKNWSERQRGTMHSSYCLLQLPLKGSPCPIVPFSVYQVCITRDNTNVSKNLYKL